MWSLFSRSPLPDYEIGDDVDHDLASRSLWSLKNGRVKKTGKPVSIFVGNAKDSNCRRGYARYKTLKHPNILPWMDGVENDKELYMVTKRVTPALNYLRENPRAKEEIPFAVVSIAEAIRFLNLDAKLCHNAVQLGAVYVSLSLNAEDNGYAWMLGAMDYCVAPPGESNLPASLARFRLPQSVGGQDSVDVWGLGCLIWEMYNLNITDFQMSCLRDIRLISNRTLKSVYQKALSSQAKSRIAITDFRDKLITDLEIDDTVFKTFAILQSDKLFTVNPSERRRLVSQVEKLVTSLPNAPRKYGVLSRLMSILKHSSDGIFEALLLPLMFQIGCDLSDEEYKDHLVLVFVNLFNSNNRSIRMILLDNLDKFIDHISEKSLNETLFMPLCRGLLDTHSAIREATLRSFLLLAPRLSNSNLNVELMRFLATIQVRDSERSIRTNCTILLAHIAPFLDKAKRSDILIGAFSRALNDPFEPAKKAGLSAIQSCLWLFSPGEKSKSVLPMLCPLLFNEPSADAFEISRKIIIELEDLYKGGFFDQKIAQPSLETAKENAKSSWSSWAKMSLGYESNDRPSTPISDKQSEDNSANKMYTVSSEYAAENGDRRQANSFLVAEKQRPGRIFSEPTMDDRSYGSHDDDDDDDDDEGKHLPIRKQPMKSNQPDRRIKLARPKKETGAVRADSSLVSESLAAIRVQDGVRAGISDNKKTKDDDDNSDDDFFDMMLKST